MSSMGEIMDRMVGAFSDAPRAAEGFGKIEDHSGRAMVWSRR